MGQCATGLKLAAEPVKWLANRVSSPSANSQPVTSALLEIAEVTLAKGGGFTDQGQNRATRSRLDCQ
jgi:hypothetical protein